jgi:hypothetical protein
MGEVRSVQACASTVDDAASLRGTELVALVGAVVSGGGGFEGRLEGS